MTVQAAVGGPHDEQGPSATPAATVIAGQRPTLRVSASRSR
ncbi:hypothetical protein I548_2897 [Mycobacterium intracellulare]|nr:hypothetical protein I548_2897 [Mycobacterium intracellulare]